MPRLYKKTLIDASLDDVWAFHEDTERGLTTLSPPDADVTIVRADEPGVGAQVVINAKTPIGRKDWVAIYRQWQPPRGSRPHRAAWFVDEALESPFKSWVHTHRFEETIHEGRSKVMNIDDVRYEVPLGPLGAIGNVLIVRPQLEKMFKHRHKMLHEVLGR